LLSAVSTTTPALPVALNPPSTIWEVITPGVRIAASAIWPRVRSTSAIVASSIDANACVAPSSIAFSRLFSSGSTATTYFAPA
jgi:hypothetical protein